MHHAPDAASFDRLLERLFPICRSITGSGVRETLKILNEYIPLTIHEVPSGTKVFDWTVPSEWNIADAYIKNSRGERIIDFKANNLHVVNYSTPVHQSMTLAELRPHLHSLPEQPDIIPYKTSYYHPNWGFCLTHNQALGLTDDTYEVVIDSTLAPGNLTYGELFVPGEIEETVLISCYVCHPSMANDNLSGVVLSTFLAREILAKPRRHSYRFLFVPETIGTITWLARNEQAVSHIAHGLVATCIGDKGPFTYKKSRSGRAQIDLVAAQALREAGVPHSIIDFAPTGSDERQYCSPGFDLPVGSLMRTMYGQFSQYHTSADDLSFVRGEYLVQSLSLYNAIVSLLETNARFERNHLYKNINPKAEPQLGKRGLYTAIGPSKNEAENELAMFWVLNLSDGTNSLLDIALRSNIPFERIREIADILIEHRLLEEVRA